MKPPPRSALSSAASTLSLACAVAASSVGPAHAAYWNLFNFEGESVASAVYVTYDTLADMLADTNRTGNANPGSAANNVVGGDSDGTTWWSLFNFEGESVASAVYVTYGSLADMLNDTNRTGNANPGAAANNVVGSGSDGTTWWSLFNFEGEGVASAVYVTYGSLADMLNDTNRTGNANPGTAANNVIGTGSDGETYWSVFNFEGEGVASAVIVTYDTLTDMLNDTNRTGNSNPGTAANNVIGSGADIRRASPIPEPPGAWLLAAALAAFALLRPRRPSPRVR